MASSKDAHILPRRTPSCPRFRTQRPETRFTPPKKCKGPPRCSSGHFLDQLQCIQVRPFVCSGYSRLIYCREFAWGHDDLTPETKGFFDGRNGWGATIVDAMTTAVGPSLQYIVAQELIFSSSTLWASR